MTVAPTWTLGRQPGGAPELSFLLGAPAAGVRLVFTPHAWGDYLQWVQSDQVTLKRANRLLGECLRDPYAGVGKPEQLRHVLAGSWSRRITEGHRLVYLVDDDDLVLFQVRHHY